MEKQNEYVNVRLEEALIEFIERAASKKATTAEIEALPAVADVLVKIIYPDC